jgi:hypothetical protein
MPDHAKKIEAEYLADLWLCARRSSDIQIALFQPHEQLGILGAVYLLDLPIIDVLKYVTRLNVSSNAG